MPTIFLSAASIDLREWREVLDGAFRGSGFRVLNQDESFSFAPQQRKAPPDRNHRRECLASSASQFSEAAAALDRLGAQPRERAIFFHDAPAVADQDDRRVTDIGFRSGEPSVPVPLRGMGIGVVVVKYRLSPDAKSPAFIEAAAGTIAWTFQNIAIALRVSDTHAVSH